MADNTICQPQVNKISLYRDQKAENESKTIAPIVKGFNQDLKDVNFAKTSNKGRRTKNQTIPTINSKTSEFTTQQAKDRVKTPAHKISS